MLLSVMPAAGDEEPEEAKSASGEFWSVRYVKSLVNISPKVHF